MTDYDLDQDDECPLCGGPLASDGVCADDSCGDDEPNGLPEVPAPNSEES